MPRKTNKPNSTNPGRTAQRAAAPASPPAALPLTSEQRARRLLAEGQPSLEAEIEMQRQANQRLQALWDALEQETEPDAALQVKVAAALTTGTGRVARLLRDQRALSGEAADGLTAAVAKALDELSSELGVAL